jgi:voltage-gated potassium channel Kch
LFGAVVTLSMAATPFLMKLTERLEQREERSAAGFVGPEDSPTSRAIVVGYGRFGQTVGQMLMAKKIAVTLIDMKPQQIEISEEFGSKVYYGDGTRVDLLRMAGGESAEAIMFCIDGEAPDREKLSQIIEAFPQAQVMVRAFDRRHVMALDGLDLAFVQREVFESAVSMGRAALKVVGLPAPEIDRVEREYRLRDCERLERQSATGDLHAASERMFSISETLPDER